KAPTKLAVTLPTAMIEKNGPYDFKNLGDIVGTGVIPRQPTEAEYSPPKSFSVDVTRAVKMIAAGEAKFRGFAIRVIPDRSVDDGWTTRLDLPKAALMQLELDVYEKKKTKMMRAILLSLMLPLTGGQRTTWCACGPARPAPDQGRRRHAAQGRHGGHQESQTDRVRAV